MSDYCAQCRVSVKPGDLHCRTCHMSLPFGKHGWVAVESPDDPERRYPRKMMPCPDCLWRVGRVAASA